MSTRNNVTQLVAMVEAGQLLEAFEQFYADEVVMQENTNPATVGKDANRVREIEVLSSVKEVHVNRSKGVLVDGDEAVILWELEFTNQDGVRIRLDQVAHQQWRDGKIVRERFVYDSNAVVQQPEAVLA